MAQVVSTINLKGGVGKTHTTVALAEVFSAYFRKKVLVIDLDPQTNATTMLIGEDKSRTEPTRSPTICRRSTWSNSGTSWPSTPWTHSDSS